MYILKNAWISINRNKGRNILIGLIILVIAAAATITLAINNTATDLINSYVNAYDKEVTISFDRTSMSDKFDPSDKESREEMKEAFNNVSAYSVEDINNFADSKYIENYYYTYSISLNGNNIEKAESDSGFGGRGGKGPMNTSNSMDFTLQGYSSIDSMTEFIDGTYSMSEITEDAWNIAFDGNYVFINEELANYNELELNDKIILEDETEKTYEFEIIGIFEDNDTSSNSPMSMFSNSVNTIVINANALINITNESEDVIGTVNPTFIIDEYDNLEKLQSEFYEKGLDETYILESNEEVATSGVSSIQNIKSFSLTFLIITLIIGGIVLFVINMINIRERKYEIGVLRTIGVSKLKLTSQFVFELLIVALACLLLGAGIGAVSSKSVSNLLLANEISSSEEQMNEMQNNFGGRDSNRENMESSNKGDRPNAPGGMNKINGVPSIQAYDSVDAVVDIKVLLELLVIGLSLVLVSSLSAMISIQRFSPLTILKERS